MRKTSHIGLNVLVMLLVGGFLAAVLPGAAYTQTIDGCFPGKTAYCIEGRIRQFWEQNGGLSVFGYPIRAQGGQEVEGQWLQVQWFERNRIELHPEKSYPYDVELGRLGDDRLRQRGDDWQNHTAFPPEGPRAGCRFFPGTSHNVCGSFWSAWRANGLERDGNRFTKTEAENLALFGLPLSGERMETIDGRSYRVQWFERARFEYHPENAPPYDVLFGLLSNEIAQDAARSIIGLGGFPTPPGVIRPGQTPCPRTPPPAAPPEVFTLDQPKEIATRFAICFHGLAPNQNVSAQVTRPDSVVEATAVITTTERGAAGLFYESMPGDPLGEYAVSAIQGALQVTTTFTIIAPTQPRILVTPPSGPPGTTFQVVLAGFQPVELVPLHIFRNAIYVPPPEPLQQPIAQVDYQGTGVFFLETQDFLPALYIIDPGTLKELARRGDPRMFLITQP